jgi:hypothetical protein
VLKSLADWITQPAVHEVGCEAFWGLGFGIKLYPNPASEKGKMGERKRKKEKERKLALGEKNERMLAKRKRRKDSGTSKPVLVLRKSYS